MTDNKYGFVIYETMWLYHPVHAPQGQIFNGSDLIREYLDMGWTDTPAKFKLPEVLAKVDSIPDFASMTRLDLQAWLKERNVLFAVRWGKDELVQSCIKHYMEQ